MLASILSFAFLLVLALGFAIFLHTPAGKRFLKDLDY